MGQDERKVDNTGSRCTNVCNGSRVCCDSNQRLFGFWVCRCRTFSATVEEYHLLREYLSDRHLHLVCRTESQERNITTRISASLVLSSEQRNIVVQWLMYLRIVTFRLADVGTGTGHTDQCFFMVLICSLDTGLVF